MMNPRMFALTVASAVSVLSGSAILIKPWEGLYTKPYYDSVHVKTVCYGATSAEGVDLNKTYTPAECDKMLADGLPKYYYGWIACVDPPKVPPVTMQIAWTSVTYNIGISAFCHSTMAKRMTRGDFQGACNALLMWDMAGGAVLKGLHNRRVAERVMCQKDL